MGDVGGKKGAVIARIEGGLGNQLFMYAAARRLAIRNRVPLRLDLTGYTEDPYHRQYSLHHFNIQAQRASAWESYTTGWGQRRKYFARKINAILPFHYRFFIEQKKPFDFRLLDFRVSRRVYLRGYWQAERYFKDIEPTIRKEFAIISPHTRENVEWAKRISNTNAVCLHARRRHYPYALSVEYYQKAVKYVAGQVQHPHFFCFSDSSEWIKENLRIDYPVTLMEHNTDSMPYEDLWLMTHCKHYIIANSTFSWWGAWLNPDSQKIVVAPATWGYDTAVPKGWKRIDT